MLLGGAVVKGFAEMVEGAVNLGSQINDSAAKLGVGTDELQQFQYAAKLTGVESEQAAQALGFLNKNMGEALTGGKSQIETFQKLGVSIKNADGSVRAIGDVIPELADKFAAMGSDQERTAMAMQIFGKSGAALLPMLKGGGKGLSEMNAEFKALGLGIDKEFIAAADDAGDQLDKLKMQFTVVKTKMVAEALPAIKEITGWLLKMGVGVMKLAKETNIMRVVMGFMAIATGVAAVGALSKFATALGFASKSMAVLSFKALLIIAAIALIALVIEDIYTLFTGGQSVIGDFIDSLFGIGASQVFVEAVEKAFTEVWEAIKPLLPLIMELGGILSQAFTDALPTIKEVAAWLLKAWAGEAKGAIQDFIGFVKEAIALFQVFTFLLSGFIAIGQVLYHVLVDPFVAMIGYVKDGIAWAEKLIAKISSIPGVGGAIGNMTGGVGGGIAGGVASVLPSTLSPGAGGTNNVTQDNKTTINVNGAGDPGAVSKGVAGTLGDMFETQKRAAMGAISSYF